MIVRVRSHKADAERLVFKTHTVESDGLRTDAVYYPVSAQTFGFRWEMDGRIYNLTIDPKEAGALRDHLTNALARWGKEQEEDRARPKA